MGKQHLSRDERLIMQGRLKGTQENMDMVAMVLMDKCGWHVFEETSRICMSAWKSWQRR